MEAELQIETASSKVVHAVSPVAHTDGDHKNTSEGVATKYHTTQIKVEEPAVEVDTSRSLSKSRRTLLGRVLNMKQFGKVIPFVVAVVTPMSESSEKQKNISLGFLAAIFVVYAMKDWVMTGNRKVITFGIVFNFAKLLSFYLLLCILKPDWLSAYGIVLVYTFPDELKTKFTGCCEKIVPAINYVTDKVSKPLKDQASPASPLPRASV